MKTNKGHKSRSINLMALATIMISSYFIFPAHLLAEKQEQLAPPEIKQDNTELTIKVTQEEITNKNIYFGVFSESIKNPRCIQLDTLLRNTKQYREIQKSKIHQGEAKYWILLAGASESVYRQINNFCQKHQIYFLCERKTLFAVLRKIEEFKSKTETQLIEQFDLTQRIMDFAKEESKRKDTETSTSHFWK